MELHMICSLQVKVFKNTPLKSKGIGRNEKGAMKQHFCLHC
jgi:hypothetical protein